MKKKSPRNQTLTCNQTEIDRLSTDIRYVNDLTGIDDIGEKIICGDAFDVAEKLPGRFADLLILDPPYNLDKNYNGHLFKEKKKAEYQQWFRRVIEALMPTIKPTATVYVCSDWKTSLLIVPILELYFLVQNRITWEREKGRGAKSNWKNNTEDIWFCTVSGDYYFDVDSVKLKRKVVAPYRVNGKPKDWSEEDDGNYRLTHPSNIWTDISIPFWSMPENTDHPTQKPEKLFAKLILASSKPGDFVFDPFAGSGTTAVVAKKLRRRFVCVELNREYCCWGQKRLIQASPGCSIQGYAGGAFWERNTLISQLKNGGNTSSQMGLL